jgi:coenzyme F420 biosynthesis associated uncharacterized protein
LDLGRVDFSRLDLGRAPSVDSLRAAAGSTNARRAVQIGLAVGAGIAARWMADRVAARSRGGLVDWRQAEQIAARRLRAAPGSLSRSELERAAPAYQQAMARIVPLLEKRLGTPLPGVVDRHAVVDRAGWAHANMGMFRELVGHLEGHLGLTGGPGSLGAGVAAIANRFVTTRQIGLILGFLGTRVLGQYDVALLSAEQAPGRLLFVEENIRSTARSLDVPLDDFRLWIALHEATHAFELEAHPWLRPYLKERLERQIALFLDEARALQARGLRHLAERWRSAAAEGSIAGFMTPEQRGLLRETQLVMSLMEGFSDWVMDEVGEQALPDVRGIRKRFEQRRTQRRNSIDRLLARLTGLDLKLEQYRRGERFVAGVWKAGGDEAIHHLWDGPAALPSDQEMEDPSAWVRRVVPNARPGHALLPATAAPKPH